MNAILKITKTLVLTALTTISFAQNPDKMLDIESGITLVGTSKKSTPAFISAIHYHLVKTANNVFTYEKDSYTDNYTLNVAFKNGKVDAMSWREYQDYMSEYTFKLENKLGFRGDKKIVKPGFNVFTYKNYQENLLVTIIYRYNDDIDHCTITVGLINQFPVKVADNAPKSRPENINSYALIAQLPNPRKTKFTSVLKVKTLQSVDQVTSFYKKLGAKNFYGNSFYLSSSPDNDDSCISVQIKKQAQFCLIEFGRECD